MELSVNTIVRKVMAAMLMVLVVTSFLMTTRAVARPLPAGAQQAATARNISINNEAIPASPPTIWPRLLLSLEEEKTGAAGHSCRSGDPHNGCP
ncbi:hypothetical protein BDA96_01G372000 [Sorghum bicolor]|uniref:Uncharacterized protein n=2 Tax=Sorghum bicolor TaxID=4558 RepID=A0A921S5C4_SORBI|nr:hypothetical protein BDA96_01G372000 [Sorghum bicolor]KXG39214.1 hypothetical protein SORBI_3001G348700 [Sorghum bicolor]